VTPQINLSDALMAQLKSVAEPFVDTPESVIQRAVDFYISNHTSGKDGPTRPPSVDAPMNFPGDGAPDLTFSRPIWITVGGVEFEKKNLYWNTLLMRLVAIAGKKLPLEQLKHHLLVNYVMGEGDSTKGFRYVPDARLSVQAQDANAAWRAAFHLVKALHLSIDVRFVWENKDKAAFPGRTGRIQHDAV
jgi:hypothetical protein